MENLTLDEVLDILFTHEKGQCRAIIPLHFLSEMGAFDSLKKFESTLKLCFQATACSSVVKNIPLPPPKLFKISICIYSSSFEVPQWYTGSEFNGKFYYD